MPTYEYECTNGHHFEAVQRISDEPLRSCKVCRAKVRRLISATSFILKGGGWYSDGYSSSGGNGKKSSDSGGSESKSPSPAASSTSTSGTSSASSESS